MKIFRSVGAAALALSLCFTGPVQAGLYVEKNLPSGDPPLASGVEPVAQMAYRPDTPLIAEAPAAALDLNDLGFEKKDTEQDLSYQNELNRRSHMLKTHQILGLATGAAMLLTLSSANDSVGEKGDAGKSARDRHALYGITTGALYFTTAAFSLLAPRARTDKKSGRTRIHRALAYIHFPAMLATMYYGITDKHKLDNGQDPSGHKGTAANIAAVSFLSALAVMVIPFGGDK